MKKIVGVPNLSVYSQQELNENINKLLKEDNIIDVQFAKTPNEEDIIDLVYESIPLQNLHL
jgi:hypothetical protein